MPEKEKLDIHERLKVLRIYKESYRTANRKEKGEILDQLEELTKLNRKTLIRRLKGSCVQKKRRRQRGRRYGAKVDDALRVIWEAHDYICAERLTPNLVWMAEHLARHGEMRVDEELTQKLGQVSVSTVQRILQRISQDQPRRRRRKKAARAGVRGSVPMRRIPWDEKEPGHFEVDLVHHCGRSASGDYLCTLQMVDVATGWSELAALLGRSYLVMTDGFRRCLRRLPFEVHEIHPDNGSEFFSGHVLRLWQEKAKNVKITRSRPYHKNDNRFVEHRNGALVRAYIGHDRLDTAAQTRALNALYNKLWFYFNFFQPIMRLESKQFLPDQGRVRRRYDDAQTPFDRLVATGVLPAETQQRLATLRQRLNPRQLRRSIENSSCRLFSLPAALPGRSEDVYRTLCRETLLERSGHAR